LNRLRRSGRGPTPQENNRRETRAAVERLFHLCVGKHTQGSETMGEVQTARLFGLSLAATLFVVLALNVYAYH
jgi:hypothetical protein